jgi:hypothetical protein
MIEVLGATNFYLVDGARAVVCVICAIAFGRMLAKIFQEDE